MADIVARAGSPLSQMGSSLVSPSLANLLGFDPFRDFFSTWQQAGGGIDVQRTEDGYNVEMPVAGFRPEEVSVTVEERTLTVSGETERRKFTRTIILPEDIDTENIEARVENGLLTLALRLHPRAQPKKIAVKYAGSQEDRQ